ncbi:MAG: O-antigen ligase family protein [Bacteroidetes bacterium]|nr:O-antigen ligase family protein [Bacteroidota bacterium]MBS1941238.1 O-antigen ligase family protein [Bacteroidota bacterium]
MMTLSAVALAICLPLAPDLVPLLMVVLAFSAIWPVKGRRERHPLRPDSPLLWMFLLYLLHLAGLLWTTNMDFAGLDLGIKAPLLVFPLMHIFGRPVQDRESVQRWFIGANVLAVALCLLHAVVSVVGIVFGNGAHHNLAMSGFALSVPFFSSDFSLFLHPTYMAMYLTLALLMLLRPGVNKPWGPRWARVAGMLLLLGVVLCASKAGWLLLFVAGLGLLAERWSDRSTRRMVAWGLVLALVSGVALYLGTDFVHERVGQVVRTLQESGPDQQASNSTDDRRLVWRAAAGVVAAHPWSGVGTGDVKDELLKVYAERGYAEPLRKKLNAHDQYLNTGVALGIGGMLLLLLMVVVPTAFAARKRQVLLISFLLLNALNWLVESMLEVQAGVVFFAFFAWLLTPDESRTSPPSRTSTTWTP